jgi:NADH:ubiquinone oxidoreductase subunit 2 (subunit N)
MATPGKYGRIAGLVLHVLLGGLIMFAGAMKLAGMMPPEATQKMPSGISSHLKLIGAGEVVTAVLLIVPLTSSLGVLLASGFWGGVICIQMAQGNDFIFPSVLLALTWLGAYLRDPRVFYSFQPLLGPKEGVGVTEGLSGNENG